MYTKKLPLHKSIIFSIRQWFTKDDSNQIQTKQKISKTKRSVFGNVSNAWANKRNESEKFFEKLDNPNNQSA